MDGQGVHVKAQQQHTASWMCRLALHQPHHASLTDAGSYGITQLAEPPGDDAGSALFLKGQLRVLVKVSARGHELAAHGERLFA
jgi:hypothetical protein